MELSPSTNDPSRNKIPFSKLAGVLYHPVLQGTGRYRVPANPCCFWHLRIGKSQGDFGMISFKIFFYFVVVDVDL